jgi:hypothetical protein
MVVAAVEVVLVVVLVFVLDDSELPHAARPSVSSAQLASAPIFFLITTSPLAGLSFDGAKWHAQSAGTACRGQSLQPPVASM